MSDTGSNAEDMNSVPPLLSDDASESPGEKYKYRDFSGVTAEDEDDVLEAAPVSTGSRGNSESSIRVQKFPVKLYAILAQKEFHDIICWMPHGRAWKVLKPSLFESLVMPLFFEYNNYHSFNRLVNAWSFRRVSSGPDRGAYYHELFLRGKPHLQKYMRRLPKSHKKMPMDKKDEPDFFALDKTNPLPALEDAPVPAAEASAAAMRRARELRNQMQVGAQVRQPVPTPGPHSHAVPTTGPHSHMVTPPHSVTTTQPYTHENLYPLDSESFDGYDTVSRGSYPSADFSAPYASAHGGYGDSYGALPPPVSRRYSNEPMLPPRSPQSYRRDGGSIASGSSSSHGGQQQRRRLSSQEQFEFFQSQMRVQQQLMRQEQQKPQPAAYGRNGPSDAVSADEFALLQRFPS